jgi:hypothetical protein
MKKDPEQRKLENVLRNPKFSACGFLGDDTRTVWEIIDADAAELERLDVTREQIATRMEELTEQGIPGMGDWVTVSDTLQVQVDDTRGSIPCPWAHGVRCLKRITTIERIDTGQKLRWSDLTIHLIKEHGFFQGKNSPYRLEPKDLIKALW